MYYLKSYDEFFEEIAAKDDVVVYGNANTLESRTSQHCQYKKFTAWNTEKPYTFFLAQNSSYTELFSFQ